MKTSLNGSHQNLVNNTHLIYEVLRSYPANFMNIFQLFMEIWSFETIHCLKFNRQSQKRHDITNDVKVNILICGFVGCMKNMPFLANILLLLSLACVQGNLQKS